MRELLQALWKRLWIVLTVVVMLTGVAVGFSLIQTPTYEASLSILVGQEQESTTATSLEGEIKALQTLTQTLAEGVTSGPVLEAVIRRLDLQMSPQDLEERLSVQQIPDTLVVEVRYRDTDPERAQQVVNTLGDVFSEQVPDISPSANPLAVTLWKQSEVPDRPISPDPLRNGLLALALGLVLGVGLALLLEYMDDSWISPEEVEEISGVPTLTAIPEYTVSKGKEVGR